MAVAKRTWTTPSDETRTAWVVRYYDADKKYRQRTFRRERDAKAWEAQTAVDLKKGIHQPDSTSITVSEAAALWLARTRADKLEPTTISFYESNVRLHIEPAIAPQGVPNGWKGKLGDVRLSQLTTPMCLTFSRLLMETTLRNRNGKFVVGKTISRRTARGVLVSFKAILKEAQVCGLIVHNPAQPIGIARKIRDQVPMCIGEQIPSKDELRAILAASGPKHPPRKSGMPGRPENPFRRYLWYPLFLVAAFTGMRSSELRGLVWRNVDLDRRVLRVRQRADHRNVVGSCKSVSAYREIQISDAVASELRRWRPICPPGPLDLVFPNVVGRVHTHARMVGDGWYRIQKEIGLKRSSGQHKYCFHSLRHFYASLMIEQGTPPKRLQSLLGHATISMTMDTYGHLFPAGEDEIMRINNAVASVLTDRRRAVPRVQAEPVA